MSNSKIGYKNLYTDAGATVTASNEASGFEKENAYDGLGHSWWKPTNLGYHYLQVEFAVARTVDYYAIFNHEMGSKSTGYYLRYSDDGATWYNTHGIRYPQNDKTIFRTIDADAHKYWRITFRNVTETTAIGGVLLGESLDLESGVFSGFAPSAIAPVVKLKTAMSESGAFIGGSQLDQGVKGTIPLRNLTPALVRSDLKPFFEHIQTPKPFVFSWDTVNYSSANSEIVGSSSTAQAGAVNTITLASGSSGTDDYYNGYTVHIREGTGVQQQRTIIDYDGTTKVAIVGGDWDTIPDATSVYTITDDTLEEVVFCWLDGMLPQPTYQDALYMRASIPFKGRL